VNRTIHHMLCLAGMTVILTSCGGSDDDAESTPATQSALATESTPATQSTPDTEVVSVESTADTAPATSAAPTVDILTDFGDVCRGVTLPGATAYDPTRSGVHPIMTVAGEPPEYEAAGANLPDQWDPVIGEEQTVELVVCLDRTAATARETCTGYLDDAGADTGNTVEMYDVTYAVRLVAATTGDEVATTQLDATGESCPMLALFEEGESVKAWYSEPTDGLTAWLAPHVET